jgi:purine-cytosine permease-like protein
MRIFKLMFNSFIIGLVISTLAFQSEWLEMRMNIGYFIPITMILALIGYFLQSKRYPRFNHLSLMATIANIFISSAICAAVLGFERLLIVPAAIIRELLLLTKIPFDRINIGLILLMIIGLLVIWLGEMKIRKAYR